MASETYKLALHSRSVLRGISDSPQGADAIPELARTAYADMAAAYWVAEDAPPSMPTHEYDRSAPSGDAFAALWGYSAAGRTMQSNCGAVCYTYAVPADAVDQETHGACIMETVAVGIRGDRYLDAGAIVCAVPSATDEPPTWPQVLAAAFASGPVCATSDQVDSRGDSLAPNKRAGETATVALAPGAAPLRFLHVVIRLADYLATRGAWIEGGAMLVAGSAEATYSRAVEPDETGTPMDAAVYWPQTWSGAPGVTFYNGYRPHIWYAQVPAVAQPFYEFSSNGFTRTDLSTNRLSSSLLFSGAGYFDAPDPASSTDVYPVATLHCQSPGSLNSGEEANFGLTPPESGSGAIVPSSQFHAITFSATYGGMRLMSPAFPATRFRLLVYGSQSIPTLPFALAADSGGYPAVLTRSPFPAIENFLSEPFRSGRASSLFYYSSFPPYDNDSESPGYFPHSFGPVSTSEAPQSDLVGKATVSTFPVVPLACVESSGTVTDIAFTRRFATVETASVFLFLLPLEPCAARYVHFGESVPLLVP